MLANSTRQTLMREHVRHGSVNHHDIHSKPFNIPPRAQVVAANTVFREDGQAPSTSNSSRMNPRMPDGCRCMCCLRLTGQRARTALPVHDELNVLPESTAGVEKAIEPHTARSRAHECKAGVWASSWGGPVCLVSFQLFLDGGALARSG